MDKAKFQKTAQDVFSRHKNEKKVFVTSDGQVFFDESHARNHAVNNRSGKTLEVTPFERDDETKSASATGTSTAKTAKVNKDTGKAGDSTSETAKADKSTKETEASTSKTTEMLIAEIAAAGEVADVQAILNVENAGKKRKTVIEAAEKRIVELNNDQQ